MVIMFHSITNNAITSSNQISESYFRSLMKTLHDDGFQAITTVQLADFMESNAKIPERSVLLVVDDRKNAEYFNVLFRQYWDKYGWPVVNAWISLYGRDDPSLAGNVTLSEEGWVDYQAHGFIHNIPIGPDSTDEYILGELQKPIDFFKANFHKTPIAVIWPGGGFTPYAAVVARQLGYRLGFTTNPRGPVMFDWVPLAQAPDPQRPTWIAEGPVNDPLMVLPRYWDTDAISHIPQVLQVGQEAAAYAAENKATELEYYDIVCAPKYGPIP
jgi:peptidoglycan/xylan/chitin deacetylase (PgdA/CDA1 family)